MTDRPDVDTPQASYDDLERLVASVGTADEWRAFVRLLREAGYEIRPTGIGRREARDDG